MVNAKLDENSKPALIAVSSSDGTTIVPLYADPSTHRLLVSSSGGGSITVTDGVTTVSSVTTIDFTSGAVVTADGAGTANVALSGSGGGSVTSVSVVSANGFTGTVATATTTPAITLTTSITGILQGNGTAISAASTTGSGSVVLNTSPTLVTPTLGIANATSLGVSGIITTGTNGGTNGSITFSGSTTGSTVLQVAATTSGTLTLPAATDTLVGRNTTDTLTNKTLTSPVLTTPILGVATATTINKVTLTAPATGSTLTIADGKTLTSSNTIILTGTDGVSINISNAKIESFGMSLDGGGSTLTTGQKGYITVPYAGTITGWNITADGSSPTCTIDIWKVATGTTLPTVANTITAAALPALATGNAIHSNTTSGWTTSVAANDIFGFNLNAVTVATKISLAVELTKS